jgi:hypothetical protein
MIDFEPRPFREDLEPPIKPAAEPKSISEPVPTPQPESPRAHGDKKPVDEKPGNLLPQDKLGVKRQWLYVIGLLLLISLTTYYFVTHQGSSDLEIGGCMIWTGEKYQQVACGYKTEDNGISAVPLDTAVLRHFKKIMKNDTLTANSIGKVFCVKINGKYEYYTDSAANPVYPERPLRRLTQYIMNNNP